MRYQKLLLSVLNVILCGFLLYLIIQNVSFSENILSRRQNNVKTLSINNSFPSGSFKASRLEQETPIFSAGIQQHIYNSYDIQNTQNFKTETPTFFQVSSILPTNSTTKALSPQMYKCCTPQEFPGPIKQNIFYMKLHKCGSSTVQNILMRFGLRNQLDFMLPKIYYYVSYYEPFSEFLLPPQAKPPNGKYNILTHHTRYSPTIKKLMYNDTVVVTMLRSPAAIFESLYNYFKLNYVYGQTFDNFIKNPPQTQPVIQNLVPIYHGYNQMSVDLGFDKRFFKRESAIKKFIELIDQQFDFVMIVEYFDESLVLLANLMNWPLENVKYLPVNRRQDEKKRTLTDSEQQILQKANNVDTILYNHFKRKFQVCIRQYGEERLQQDVQKLRKLNMELKEKCVRKETKNGLLGATSYENRNPNDWECIYSTKLELPFTDELRFRQFHRITLNKLRPKLNMR